MRAVAPLVLATSDRDWRVRDASVLSLGFFNMAAKGPVFEAVLARLGDEQINVRRSSVLTLGRLGRGSPGVYEALTALQEDRDELLRLNVFLALQLLGNTRLADLNRLLNALETPDNATSEMATEILSSRGSDFSEALKPRLVSLLENPSQDLMSRILRIFNNLADMDETLAGKLVQVFPAMDRQNRINTLKLLARMDNEGKMILQLCLDCLGDSEPTIIKEGLICATKYRQSFEQYNYLIIPLLSHADEETRLLAVSLIKGACKTGTNCITPLIELLNDPSDKVRIVAASALGSLGGSSEEALEALSRTLKHEDERLRLSCVSALKIIGRQKSYKVIPVLEKALEVQADIRTQRIIAGAIKELKGINSLKQ